MFLVWEQLKKFRTLFSDLTRGDLDNFIRYMSNRNTFWLEILKDRESVGMVTLESMHMIVDAEAHVLFMDRDLADKVIVCKAIILWLFDNFPLQRLTVQIPNRHFTLVRFVKNLGFKIEGKKRQAVLINAKWVDVYILGLLRSEAK